MTTKIEWTDRTINFVYGCTKASPGCLNCYAEKMSQRQVNMGNYPAEVVSDWKWTGEVVCDEEAMRRAFDGLPAKTAKPHVFVCSMADLFHRQVSSGFIARAFRLMAARPHLTFQLLTKRAQSMAQFAADWTSIEGREWPRNVWAGVTVEDQQRADARIPFLLQVPAPVRFLSCEPLLGEIDPGLFGTLPGSWTGGRYVMAYERINWVLVGAETGPGKRPMDPAWAMQIRDECHAAGVPFLFKKDSTGSRLLDGQLYDEVPDFEAHEEDEHEDHCDGCGVRTCDGCEHQGERDND